jgi:translation initiation factor 1 (eIF-1/SUI1)
MTEIQGMMPTVDKPAHPQGSQPYENWVVQQRKEDHSRDILTYLEHLNFYNTSLMINEEIRAKDALGYLQKNIQPIQPKQSTEVEIKLQELFDKAVTVIRQDLEDSEPNPGLKKLEERLREKLSCSGHDSKGIIFVRTRFVAEALVDWLEDSQSLRNLVKNPTSVIGCGQRNGKGNYASVLLHCRQ